MLVYYSTVVSSTLTCAAGRLRAVQGAQRLAASLRNRRRRTGTHVRAHTHTHTRTHTRTYKFAEECEHVIGRSSMGYTHTHIHPRARVGALAHLPV